jgi:ubiquinone/menaquinone biosynthesis C-methylase UbiE
MALARVLEPEVMDTPEEARAYDAMDHGEVNARFCSDLLALSPPPDLSATLDVGTGTALIPIELCRRARNARVVGVDLADSMLSVARKNVERAAVSGMISIERSDARTLRFGNGALSCVVSNSIVHHIPEPLPVLREMLRVLAPRGWLFVRDLLRPATDADVHALVATYAATETPVQRALFEASLRAALSADEVRALTTAAGMPASSVTITSDRHWTVAHRKET